MKKLILILIILAIIGAFFVLDKEKTQVTPNQEQNTTKEFDAQNSTFIINDEEITLSKGRSNIQIPDSISFISTRYFGNEAIGDINGDGLSDKVFLVAQETGGTGLFYYAVAAIQTISGYKTTNAFYIGDRIAPQTTEIFPGSKEIRINYAERLLGEAMTTQPTKGATLYLKVTADYSLEKIIK